MLLEKLSRKIRVIATCATFIWIMTHFVFHGVSTFSLYLEFASLLVIFGMIPIYSIIYQLLERDTSTIKMMIEEIA